VESWDGLYSIGTCSGDRINCLNLLRHGVLTTHNRVKQQVPSTID
jgi:hypothetical protein